jgi:Flp pilus assembly protein TadG
MTLCRQSFKLVARLDQIRRDAAGVAAIEFAMILPLMLALYLGGVELAKGLSVQYKVALAARAVADLATQYSSINNATMSSILGAASTVVSPYAISNMAVTVSEVTTDSSGHGTITWSDSLNGTPYTVGQAYALPTALQTPSTSLILGEVTYPYQPSLGYGFSGTINIYQNTYFYPRLSGSVTRTNS